MGLLVHVQTFFEDQLSALSHVSRLSISSRGDDVRVRIYDPGTGDENMFILGEGSVHPDGIQTGNQLQTSTRDLTLEGRTFTVDTHILDYLTAHGGTQTAYLNGIGFYGFMASLHALEVGGETLLYSSRIAGGGLGVHRLSDAGQPDLLRWYEDTNSTALSGVSDIASIQVDGQDIVLTSSIIESTINTFSVAVNGDLSLIDSFGVADGMPIDGPVTIETVIVGGQAYALVGSHGTSSLTVLTLSETGQLDFVTQVIDNRETRFEGASALATFSQDDLHLVAIGGGDGGISLYQILEGGRLIFRETLRDSAQLALASIEQLEFVTNGEQVELMIVSSRDLGLTRLSIDTSRFGIVASGRDGTNLDDTLSATAIGGSIQAGGGDDVLLGGSGYDDFSGGAGADVFVFTPDAHIDVIRDFEALTDRIDLTGYERLNSIQDVEYQFFQHGIRLILDEDALDIYGRDGQAIDIEQLSAMLVFGDNYVGIPEALPQLGSDGNDMFIAGSQPETIDGKAGVDTVSYIHSSVGVAINLDDSSENSGSAEGYVLVSIEGLIGTFFDDVLLGNASGNNLTGLDGDDTLRGADGNDWLTPGTGSDLVDGGAGSDMVSFVDMEWAVIADLTEGTVRSGRDTNIIQNVENVTGSIFGDFIRGDENANRIRGLGDYDWIVGSDGADQVDGGTGRDMISYVYAPSRVEVDLGASIGLVGQAEGDRYVSIERVTGSIYSDLFYGSDGEDDFRGLGGYDWFVGSSGGKDRYYGGTGSDMVSYALSSNGVIASLLLKRGSAGDAARDLYDSIERLTGSNYDDELVGDNNRNELRGMFGEDALFGNGGVDRLTGGGSDDFLDGGAGFDYAIFDKNRSEYEVFTDASGVTTVRYIAGYGEGTDTLVSIEAIQFVDDILFL